MPYLHHLGWEASTNKADGSYVPGCLNSPQSYIFCCPFFLFFLFLLPNRIFYLGSDMLQVPVPSPGVNLNSSQPVTVVLQPMAMGITVWCNSGLWLIAHKGKSNWWGWRSLTLKSVTRQGLSLFHMWILFHKEVMLRLHGHLEIIMEQNDGKHLGCQRYQ